MSDKQLVTILRQLRLSRGVSQDVVAEACDISRVALTRYEKGQRVPRIEIASRLASFYGVSVDYLLGNDSQPKSVQSAPDPVPATESDQIRQQILRELQELPDSAFENALQYIRFLKSNNKDGATK